MKVIDSKGCVLLDVYGATAKGLDEWGLYDVMYDYTRDGVHGRQTLLGLDRLIAVIKLEAPDVDTVGLLPQPVVLKGD